jgi:MFS family permease
LRDTPQSAQAWPGERYAWFTCALLLLAFGLSIIDRFAIGLVVDPIKQDLGLTDTQMGLVQGLAFALFYSLFALPIGVLVDVWNRCVLVALAVALWSAATAATGLAGSFAAMFLARLVVGAGEATLLPAASSIIADSFPPDRRPRAMGVFMLGGAVGGGLAGVIVAGALWIAARARSEGLTMLAEWQLMFVLLSLPGFLLAAALLALREPVRRERLAPGKVPLEAFLAHLRPNALAYATVMGAGALVATAVAAQFAWWPTLFIRVHQWSAAQVGVVFGIVGLPLAIFSPLSAGFLLGWLGARRNDAPILVMLGQTLGCAIFATGMALAPTPTLGIALYVPMALTGIWANTAALTAINQITPNELRGRMIGAYVLLTGLIAYSLGSVSVGMLTDRVFTGAAGISPALAIVFLVFGAAATVVLLVGRGSFAAAAERAAGWRRSIPSGGA